MRRKIYYLLALLAIGIATTTWSFRKQILGFLENMFVKYFVLIAVLAPILVGGLIAFLLYRRSKNRARQGRLRALPPVPTSPVSATPPATPPPIQPGQPLTPSDDEDGETPETLLERRKKLARTIIFCFSFMTLGSGYLLYICLRLLFYELAKQDILVTLRTDGEIKAIMRGDECIRYVMKVENIRIDPEGFDLFKGSFENYANFLVKARRKKLLEDPAFVERKLILDSDGNPIQVNGYYQLTVRLKRVINEANTPEVFEEMFGIAWVGISPFHVFTYPFRWLKYGQQSAQDSKPSKEVGIFPRDEVVDSLFYRYPQYGIEIDQMETGAEGLKAAEDKKLSQVQIKATLVFETITANPQKTLFRTAALSSAGDWQQALVREITDRARVWIGSTNWDTLTRGDKKEVEAALGTIRDEINGLDKDHLPESDAKISAVRDYGQEIVKISMPKVDLVDGTLQTAYADVFKSEKERDAAKNRAEGARATAAAPVLGKADGLEKISKLDGGVEMYMSEQLGNLQGVYAPGRDNIFLNVAARATGSSRPPVNLPKKAGTDSPSGDDKK